MTTWRKSLGRVLMAILGIMTIVGLIALGSWQFQRRSWKLDLIARVDASRQAQPAVAPENAGSDDAYRRVTASGIFLHDQDSFVQAATVRGPGWWLLTPLRTESGRIILVNRGYVRQRRAIPADPTPKVVSGLLRLSEPGGGFLRANDPTTDRWYSRDVAAIAARRGLGNVASYFIDAAALPGGPDREPIGGLTVVEFPNNHLVYAITWYMLALMTAAALIYWIGLVRRANAGRE